MPATMLPFAMPANGHRHQSESSSVEFSRVQGESNLTGGQVNDAGQLQVVFPHMQPLCALCGVVLRQLPALLVLDDGEQSKGAIVPCTCSRFAML